MWKKVLGRKGLVTTLAQIIQFHKFRSFNPILPIKITIFDRTIDVLLNKVDELDVFTISLFL